MKQITIAVVLFFLIHSEVISQMQSNVTNKRRDQVTQIWGNGILLQVEDDGAGGIAINQSEIDLAPVQKNVVYEINRVRINITNFLNTIDGVQAYPLWEQFAVVAKLKAVVWDDTQDFAVKELFNGMLYSTSNGSLPELAFEEPFLIDSKISSGHTYVIKIYIENVASVFTSITGMTVPPVPTFPIQVRGSIIFEGVYYSIPKSGLDDAINNDVAIESGVDVNNAIDIEI